VHQHDRRCRQIERALHHLAYIDRGVVNGSLLLHLVGDDLIALVEEQDTEVLVFASLSQRQRKTRLCRFAAGGSVFGHNAKH